MEVKIEGRIIIPEEKLAELVKAEQPIALPPRFHEILYVISVQNKKNLGKPSGYFLDFKDADTLIDKILRIYSQITRGEVIQSDKLEDYYGLDKLEYPAYLGIDCVFCKPKTVDEIFKISAAVPYIRLKTKESAKGNLLIIECNKQFFPEPNISCPANYESTCLGVVEKQHNDYILKTVLDAHD